ncbi:glutamate synthase (NADH) small subunit [Motilibacter rhizosphaerae]|uniref:Glutamate synthase (NADH) small subunit n=1 Tax=Motilibacter rhizosphaerae TaxID=598652 RepID=A0A4V2F4C9_9ACTN|nr:glutamate synthase subunit beta [Motilibacter rhizosphaerae]RZS87167.1 glutamate synthase (NADH) small subunit [Motilibacter rhizosphaerae]
MTDPRGFLKAPRESAPRRPVEVRIRDWREVYEEMSTESLRTQAGRCMDCGIPFCHNGCPLGNLIPEWNDLAWRDDWADAIERLHATNNFPEFTGKVCPAPCESACVLGIGDDPVTIKMVEAAIADRAWDEGLVQPKPPTRLTGKTVAVVGSGPAGLAAAQQLTRAGHTVAVYERDDAPGGLMRYGIPEFKMETRYLERRIAQMRAEGTRFRCGVEVGADITAEELRERYDAVLLAVGATARRELDVPGRELAGVVQAMDYLPHGNRTARDATYVPAITAEGKDVVIIGGGDTGADCYGTAIRQGARSITQIDINPQAPTDRPEHDPWPVHARVLRLSSAHEEGGERAYALNTVELVGDGAGSIAEIVVVEGTRVERVFTPTAGTERHLPAQLVILALGFTGPERSPLLAGLGVELDARGGLVRDEDYMTRVPGVFVAGDAGRGQSLVVWAIAEGRAAAAGIDAYLTGATELPFPIPPSARPLAV